MSKRKLNTIKERIWFYSGCSKAFSEKQGSRASSLSIQPHRNSEHSSFKIKNQTIKHMVNMKGRKPRVSAIDILLFMHDNPIIHGYLTCKFPYSLKFTYNPKINTHNSTFEVIHRHVWSSENFESTGMSIFPAEVK